MRARVREEVVREWLLRQNATMGDLAERIGSSRIYLYQIMVGDRFPGPRLRASLMRELGVTDFDALFVIERPAADANGHAEPERAEAQVA